MPVDLYAYDDFRLYLSDWLQDRDGRPSLRTLAKRAEVSSSYLSYVISGQRRPGRKTAEGVARALKLVGDDHAQFLDLVECASAQGDEQLLAARARVGARRRHHAASRIVDAMSTLFARWYQPAIAEMATCAGFVPDPAWIAARLHPPITEGEAADTLDLLCALGVLRRDPDGTIQAGSDAWATEHEIRSSSTSFAVGRHQRHMMQRAADALMEFPASERHFTAVTLALSAEKMARAKQLLARFNGELLALASEPDTTRDRVYEVGMHLFPLSHRIN